MWSGQKASQRDSFTLTIQLVCGSFTAIYTNRNRFLHMSIFKVNIPVLHNKPIRNDFHYRKGTITTYRYIVYNII